MIRQSLLTKFILGFIFVLCLINTDAQFESFIFKNEGNVDVNRADIEAAAQSLIREHGARVAIYIVVTGDERDFTNRLRTDSLENSYTGRKSDLVAIYIATEEQYSEIRWGSDFDRIDGGRIRRDVLNPNLRERAFNDAIINALQTFEGDLSNPLIIIGYLLGQVCLNPTVLFIIAILIFIFIGIQTGYISGDGSSSSSTDNSSSWSSSNDSSSSWSSSNDSSSSGGGSDGGSWND